MTDQEGEPLNSLVPHAVSAELTCSQLRVEAAGLTEAEAAARRGQLGENRLPEPPRQSELRRFLRQLESPLVLVLIGAAVIATVVGFTESGGSFLLRAPGFRKGYCERFFGIGRDGSIHHPYFQVIRIKSSDDHRLIPPFLRCDH